ncbi:MAG: hypothetical protein ABL927_00535 [Bdellovibrionales bacterium]
MPTVFKKIKTCTLQIFGACIVLLSFSPLKYALAIPDDTSHSKPNSCIDALTKSKSNLTEAEKFFDKMSKNWQSGLAVRGFLGVGPKETIETSVMAEKHGIMSWTLYMFVAPDLATAQKHAQQEYYIKENGSGRKDSVLQGIYFIGSPQEEVRDMASAQKTLQKLIQNGAYNFPNPDDTSEYEFLSEARLREILNPDKDVPRWMTTDQRVGPKMTLSGWAFPKKRGILSFEKLFSSSTYQKIFKEYIKPYFINGGFKVTFNKSPLLTLDALKLQKRKYKETTENRYFDINAPSNSSDTYHTMLERIQQGQAYTVEVWDDKGELIAGTIVSQTGNLFAPDSIHYKETIIATKISPGPNGSSIKTEKEIDGINFAKVAIIALVERLKTHGVSFADAGMVTNFSNGLKAEYILAEDFLILMNQLTGPKITINQDDWTPNLK